MSQRDDLLSNVFKVTRPILASSLQRCQQRFSRHRRTPPLLMALWRGAGPLGSHSRASQDGEMPLRSGQLASPCIPGLPAENGRSGRNDGRRRWLEASAQEKWVSSALWRQSSVSIPFPCYLLLQQLARRSATALASAELSAGQFGLFLITGDSRGVTLFSGFISVKTCHWGMTATLFSSCHYSCCKQ